MDDFICEERPSSRTPRMKTVEGFVGEMRPSSRRLPRPSTHAMDEETSLKVVHDPENSQYFMELVSNKTQKEYKEILTTSIITLVQTLFSPTGHNVASIEGSLQVSFLGKQLPIQLTLSESYSTSKKDLGLVSEKNMNVNYRKDRSPSLEMTWNLDNCHYHNHFSPDLVNRDDISSEVSSPPRTEVTSTSEEEFLVHGSVGVSSDSGEESGYTTFDRDDTSDMQGGVSPRKEPPSPGSIKRHYVFGPKVSTEAIFDHDDLKPALVIDTSNLLEKTDKGNGTNQDTSCNETEMCEQCPPVDNLAIKENFVLSSSDDSENNLPSTCSEDTDSEVPMDLSGDCKIVADSQTVSKEHEGRKSSFAIELKCKKCSYTSTDGVDLSAHALREHQIYTCHHCSRAFTAKNNLKRHIRIHTGLRPYKCSQCSTTFARRDDLKGHLLRHDYNKPFRCSICKKGYTDRASVKNHMVKEHGSRMLYVCPLCGESFDRDDLFTDHKKTHPELTQYACDICPFIGSNNLTAYKHSLVHTRKLFSCKPCNAYFADPFGYTDHVRKHKKNENFFSYLCCFCDMTLPTYEQFVRHEYSHALGKTHVCHICNKQFRSKVLLHDHAQNHAQCHQQKQDVSCEESTGVVETPCCGRDHVGRLTNDVTMEDQATEQKSTSVQDEVLDLTVKKSVTSVETTNQCITNAQPFSNGQEKNSYFDVPRNGCVSDFSRPCEEDCALGYNGEMPPRSFSAEIGQRNEDYFNAGSRSPSCQSEPLDRRFPEAIKHRESMSTLKVAPMYKAHISPFKERQTHHLKAQTRHAPYSTPSNLYRKFLLARGGAPLAPIPASKDHRLLFADQEELVLEKDSTGKPSFQIVTRHDTQAKAAPSINPRDNEKQNDVHHSGHDHQMELGQSPSIVYGLTGKQYRNESSAALAPQVNESSNYYFTPVKSEPEEESSPSFDAFHAESIPETVPAFTSRTSPSSSSSFKCDTCYEEFECFSQLESHSVVTHKRYMCEYCNKGFTSRPNRDRHVRYHTGEKPYKCDLCDTAFHRGDDLKYHRTTRHPEAVPFVCSRCSASFVWKRDLDRHIRHSKCKM